jgi:hypothetical protein
MSVEQALMHPWLARQRAKDGMESDAEMDRAFPVRSAFKRCTQQLPTTAMAVNYASAAEIRPVDGTIVRIPGTGKGKVRAEPDESDVVMRAASPMKRTAARNRWVPKNRGKMVEKQRAQAEESDVEMQKPSPMRPDSAPSPRRVPAAGATKDKANVRPHPYILSQDLAHPGSSCVAKHN